LWQLASERCEGVKAGVFAPNGKRCYLGLHDTLEEAAAMRFDAAEELHGAFAREE
jgi:hypothetical protein